MFARLAAARQRRAAARQAKQDAQERSDLDHVLAWADQIGRTPVADSSGFVAHAGETVILSLPGASLIEERSTGGHFQAGSQGLSIPIGSLGGRTVRYRVGRTKGHYVKGTPTPTAIDRGFLVVTDRRVVFLGAHQQRECALDKLVAVHCGHDGHLTLSVSGRQHPVEIYAGAAVAGTTQFAVDFALARHRGDEVTFVNQLRARRAALG